MDENVTYCNLENGRRFIKIGDKYYNNTTHMDDITEEIQILLGEKKPSAAPVEKEPEMPEMTDQEIENKAKFLELKLLGKRVVLKNYKNVLPKGIVRWEAEDIFNYIIKNNLRANDKTPATSKSTR